MTHLNKASWARANKIRRLPHPAIHEHDPLSAKPARVSKNIQMLNRQVLFPNGKLASVDTPFQTQSELNFTHYLILGPKSGFNLIPVLK
jgi:hypothetical protein